MNTSSLLDAIRAVKENERFASASYWEAARKIQNPAGKFVFEELSRFEEYHYERLTNLEKLGLGNIIPVQGVAAVAAPLASWGVPGWYYWDFAIGYGDPPAWDGKSLWSRYAAMPAFPSPEGIATPYTAEDTTPLKASIAFCQRRAKRHCPPTLKPGSRPSPSIR